MAETSTSYQDLGYDRIFVSLDGSDEQDNRKDDRKKRSA